MRGDGEPEYHRIIWEPEYDKRRLRNQNVMRGDGELEYDERR